MPSAWFRPSIPVTNQIRAWHSQSDNPDATLRDAASDVNPGKSEDTQSSPLDSDESLDELEHDAQCSSDDDIRSMNASYLHSQGDEDGSELGDEGDFYPYGLPHPLPSTESDCIDWIKRISDTNEIPGLSGYISALQENIKSAGILAPAVLTCIALRRTDDGGDSGFVTLGDVLSLLPRKFGNAPPTLGILELCINDAINYTRQHGSSHSMMLLPSRLVNLPRNPKALGDLQSRLTPSIVPALSNDQGKPVETERPGMFITLLRGDSSRHTNLAITTIFRDCSTLFLMDATVPSGEREALMKNLTSVFRLALSGHDISIRSAFAHLPTLPCDKEDIGENSAYSALYAGLHFVNAERFQLVAPLSTLNRLAQLRSSSSKPQARCSAQALITLPITSAPGKAATAQTWR